MEKERDGYETPSWAYRAAQIHDFRPILAVRAMDLLLFQGIKNNPAFTKAP